MKYFHQVDFIKCFAVLSVVILHSVPVGILIDTYSVFHIWQAVPLFIMLMGFNLMLGSKQPSYSLRYFQKRYKRIIEPFIIIFIISLVFGYLFYREELYLGWMNLIGLMPKSGAGNYYITILLQFILLTPIIYWCFKKSPKLTVLLLFSMDIIFQIVTMQFNLLNDYLYSGSIFRYLSALALGMWLAKDFKFNSKRNLWIILGGILSILYLFMGNTFDSFFFNEGWRTQNILSFFYPAILIMAALNYLPNKLDYKLAEISSKIGKASYHIYLIQMIYFALVPANSFAQKLSETYNFYIVGAGLITFNLIVCVSFGLLFYKINTPSNKVKIEKAA